MPRSRGCHSTITFPGGIWQPTNTDKSGKTTSIAVRNAGNTLLRQLDYDYDDNAFCTGSTTAQRTLVQKVTDHNNRTTCYEYDVLDRLSFTETRNSSNNLVESFDYDFDGASNRTKKAHQTSGGTTTTSYAYDDANQLCWRAGGNHSNTCGSPPSGAIDYDYDNSGNETDEEGGRASIYDIRNRLTAVSGTAFGYLTATNGEPSASAAPRSSTTRSASGDKPRRATPALPQLGSPGAEDPIGEGVNVPQPAVSPGTAGEDFVDALDELGLTNVKFKVLSNPEFDPAFDEGAVVRVSPPPGTSVEPGDEVEITVNRTAQRQNNGECDRSLRRDPGPPLSGDEFSLKDTFTGRDPDQGFAPTDVPFRWGTTGWGYRHVEIGHGWDSAQDRADTQAALLDPAPEPDQPGSHRFYFFYVGPNRTPCTRRVIARFNVLTSLRSTTSSTSVARSSA